MSELIDVPGMPHFIKLLVTLYLLIIVSFYNFLERGESENLNKVKCYVIVWELREKKKFILQVSRS
jgi:hypothetical protein